MKKIALTLLGSLIAFALHAATWYVDASANGSSDGTSWQNAWKSLTAISGVSAGDTVYISGGSSSQTYSINNWSPAGGVDGNPVTYQTGQEAGYNGNVILDAGGNQFLLFSPGSNIVFSGQIPGDSGQHMTFQNNWDAKVYCNNTAASNNMRFTYISCPSHHRFIYLANPLSVMGLEIDHCYLHKVFAGAAGSLDDTFYLSGLGSPNGFGSTAKIHDNLIESPCSETVTAIGDDVVKWGEGFDFYNNHVRIYMDHAYSEGSGDSPVFQHCDVFQNAASVIRIYSNWFENIGESVYFHDNFGRVSGNFTDILFYNNKITQSFSDSVAGVARGLDFEPQDSQHADTFTRVIVANNTWNVPRLFVMRFHAADGWNSCVVENNAYVACNDASNSSWDSTAISQILVRNNASVGTSDFVNYSALDLHLVSSANDVIDKGIDASEFFATDADGNIRPQGNGWDIGAYEHVW